jgi:MFS family permease
MSTRVEPDSQPTASTTKGNVAFAALRHRDYRTYFIVTMLAMMGDNVEHVLSYWLLFQAFHSAALGGFAVISHWLPALFLSVYIGGLTDRGDCRRIIQTGQGLFILVSLAWGTLFLTGHFEVWHVCLLLVLHGLAGSLWAPASQLIIHDIVGREHLASAVRLNSTARQLGVLFGPAVGGGLLILLGAPLGLLVNVLLYLPLTIWLVVTPYTGHLRSRDSVQSRSPMPGLALCWSAMPIQRRCRPSPPTSAPRRPASPIVRCWPPTRLAQW